MSGGAGACASSSTAGPAPPAARARRRPRACRWPARVEALQMSTAQDPSPAAAAEQAEHAVLFVGTGPRHREDAQSRTMVQQAARLPRQPAHPHRGRRRRHRARRKGGGQPRAAPQRAGGERLPEVERLRGRRPARVCSRASARGRGMLGCPHGAAGAQWESALLDRNKGHTKEPSVETHCCMHDRYLPSSLLSFGRT